MSGIFGRMLRRVRAGEKHLTWNDPSASDAPASIALVSPTFEPGGFIPLRHAGKGVGENVSPALSWSGVPRETEELVLIVEDPDAPLPRPFVHAVVTGILPAMTALAEGRLSGALAAAPADDLALGKNTFGKTSYGGPRPVPGHGPHTYVFQLFALDRRLSFAAVPSRRDVVRQMRGSVVARGRLDGLYER
ncbi:MAG TPA: YbhB/YbcL family Raf kinase inhibitor-like protein [Polyangiaceae bacterium]|nr:YbhB/YbcL family Raf kinase inhibitor-like protein [Polyangiaceae bacterium]